MSNNHTRSRRPRDVDAESRKSRIQPRSGSSNRKGQRKQTDDRESDSEIDAVQSDIDLSEIDDTIKVVVPQKNKRTAKPVQKSRSSAARPSHQRHTERPDYAEQKDDAEDFLGNENVPSLIILSAALHIPLQNVTYPAVNSFFPTCWTMFNILHGMHRQTAENTYLLRLSSSYCTLVSRLYYSVLWFIQILRAKNVCSFLRPGESTFLRSFERMFPLESLVVAGPLVSYFNGLGAFHSDDPMYKWICPQIPEKLGPDDSSSSLKLDKSIRYPSVPGIASMIKAIQDSTNVAGSLNARDEFVPFTIQNGGSFAGRTIQPPTGQNPLPDNFRETLDLPGINMAPEQIPQVLAQIQGSLRRNNASIPRLTGGENLSSIRDFLLMQDMSWFHDVITVATTEASFFKGASNMNKIEASAGFEVLVVGTTPNPPTAIGRPDDWYPGLRVPNDAVFKTTRGKTSEFDFKLGVINQFIRNVPANINGHIESGTRASQDLVGEYWSNNVVQIETPTPVSAQDHIRGVIQTEYFLPKGGNYSTS